MKYRICQIIRYEIHDLSNDRIWNTWFIECSDMKLLLDSFTLLTTLLSVYLDMLELNIFHCIKDENKMGYPLTIPLLLAISVLSCMMVLCVYYLLNSKNEGGKYILYEFFASRVLFPQGLPSPNIEPLDCTFLLLIKFNLYFSLNRTPYSKRWSVFLTYLQKLE